MKKYFVYNGFLFYKKRTEDDFGNLSTSYDEVPKIDGIYSPQHERIRRKLENETGQFSEKTLLEEKMRNLW
jgi:hypothetical protein